MADLLTNVKRSANSQIVEVVVINDSNGKFLTGVTPANVIVDYFELGKSGAHVNVIPIIGDGVVDSYESLKWKEVDAATLPGVYQFSVPDGAWNFAISPSVFLVFKISAVNARDFVIQNNFPEVDLLATGLDKVIPEAGYNARQVLQMLGAAALAELTGADTSQITIKAIGNSAKQIIKGDQDDSGNRSNIILTPDA